MNSCTYEKQAIKNCLSIRLDSEISNREELNDIIKILDHGLLVETFEVTKRYPAVATIEVKSDEYKAIIHIKGNLVLVSSYYHEFNSEIRARLVEILEVEE